MPIRRAVKAGSWYPARPAELEKTLAVFCENVKPFTPPPNGLWGGIVPHAGLVFSGAVAAETFVHLTQNRPAVKTFILLGAVHTAWLDRPAVWRTGAWETPLGDIAIAEEITAALISSGLADDNPQPHLQDNALELQLPLIRYLFPEARIVPVAVPPGADAPQWGEKLAQLFAAPASGIDPRTTAIIASSDLTHYGAPYDFAPHGTGESALQWAKANDRALLELACAMQAEKIIPRAERDRSACGAGAVAMASACVRALGAPGGEILTQTTSYEVMPDGIPEMFVGYGAVVWKR